MALRLRGRKSMFMSDLYMSKRLDKYIFGGFGFGYDIKTSQTVSALSERPVMRG